MQLSFKVVEDVLATRYAIAPNSAAAFRGRLQHLQRNGFPEGVNTGKGKKAIYGWDQIIQLSTALDLIDVGMTPDTARAIVVAYRSDIIPQAAALAHTLEGPALLHAVSAERCPFHETVFLLTSASALTDIAGSGSGRALHLISGPAMSAMIEEGDPYAASGLFLDLGTRILLAIKFVSIFSSVSIDQVVMDFQEWAGHVVNS